MITTIDTIGVLLLFRFSNPSQLLVGADVLWIPDGATCSTPRIDVYVG